MAPQCDCHYLRSVGQSRWQRHCCHWRLHTWSRHDLGMTQGLFLWHRRQRQVVTPSRPVHSPLCNHSLAAEAETSDEAGDRYDVQRWFTHNVDSHLLWYFDTGIVCRVTARPYSLDFVTSLMEKCSRLISYWLLLKKRIRGSMNYINSHYITLLTTQRLAFVGFAKFLVLFNSTLFSSTDTVTMTSLLITSVAAAML